MPLGNGDIVLLLAKADAWSENGRRLKLGRIRVKITPNPFITSKPFTQTLKLESGAVEIKNGKNVARIWVDANDPSHRAFAVRESASRAC